MMRIFTCFALAALGVLTTGVAAQPPRLPVFEADPGWPHVPPNWKLGLVSSVAVDAQDNVWVLHRPRNVQADATRTVAPPVVVFDATGNFLRAWGGPGAGYEWPGREHGVHIDHKGAVWITGNGCPDGGTTANSAIDDQILKFSQDGTFLRQIGRSNQSKGNADTQNVHRAADVWVHPATNEAYVADGYGNRRVAVFDADTGRFARAWGAFGNSPAGDDPCEARTPTTFPPGPGPQQFNIVHAIRVSKDGMVYVADRDNRRIQQFTADGKFVKQVLKTDTVFARGLALSPDADQQFLYVTSGPDIAVIDRATLGIAGSVTVRGSLGNAHHMASDSKGNLYVAQTNAGIQKLTFKGGPGAR